MASGLLSFDARASRRSRAARMTDGAVRAFVAVLLPDAVRARLARSAAALRERAPELAWVRADNLHLTLRFLGQLDAAALEAARHAARAAAAGVPPFRVAIEGLGGFPTARAARVVWAGVGTGHGALVALHAVLEQALAERGIEPEARPFHPHVTLARARDQRGARGLETALGSGPAFGEFAVSAIHLMRSELAAGGSRYSVLAEAALSDLGAG